MCALLAMVLFNVRVHVRCKWAMNLGEKDFVDDEC